MTNDQRPTTNDQARADDSGPILFNHVNVPDINKLDVSVDNGGYDAFREALAKAAGTTRERVAVHCLHQHDAPGCDFDADEVLRPFGLGGKLFDPAFARRAIGRRR